MAKPVFLNIQQAFFQSVMQRTGVYRKVGLHDTFNRRGRLFRELQEIGEFASLATLREIKRSRQENQKI